MKMTQWSEEIIISLPEEAPRTTFRREYERIANEYERTEERRRKTLPTLWNNSSPTPKKLPHSFSTLGALYSQFSDTKVLGEIIKDKPGSPTNTPKIKKSRIASEPSSPSLPTKSSKQLVNRPYAKSLNDLRVSEVMAEPEFAVQNLGELVFQLVSKVPKELCCFKYASLEKIAKPLPSVLQQNSTLIFNLGSSDTVDLALELKMTALDKRGVTSIIPLSIKNQPLWSLILRFCSSYSVCKETGLWKHLKSLSLEYDSDSCQASGVLPDIVFGLQGTVKKRLETFLIIKFLLASFAMNNLNVSLEGKLSKYLFALPSDAGEKSDIPKLTLLKI